MVHGSPDVLSLEIFRTGTLGAAVNFLFSPDAIALIDIARVEGHDDHVAALFWKPLGATLALLEATGDTSLGQQVDLAQHASRIFDLGGGHLLACQAPAGSSGTSSRYVAAFVGLSEQDRVGDVATFDHSCECHGGNATRKDVAEIAG